MIEPRILERRLVWESPYVTVLEKDVDRGGGSGVETFWSVRTGGYAAVLAVTEDGLIPLVRQYRPAVEAHVLELPSGMIDAPESPASAAQRELLEETGCMAREVVLLGQLHVDSGRLETQQWAFFAPDVRVVGEPAGEDQLEVLFVTPGALRTSILAGEFNLSAHVGIVGLAELAGHLPR